jgi:hypothetical protein
MDDPKNFLYKEIPFHLHIQSQALVKRGLADFFFGGVIKFLASKWISELGYFA